VNPLRARRHPHLLQISARPWLDRLRREAGHPVPLDQVPDDWLAEVRARGFDGIWPMGLWTTGRRARQLALTYPDLLATYERIVPGWEPADVPGSPYSISAYEPFPGSGGREALAGLRERMHAHGLGLVVDYVPNHLGVDHPWLNDHPDRLVRGSARDLAAHPGRWFVHTTPDGEDRVFGHGRDPHFDGWSDTVQIDHRRRDARDAMVELLLDVASQADGVRCDVSMLLLPEVLESTWGPGDPAEKGDFWTEAFAALRARHPETVAIAEVYWGLQDRLASLGFDYAYDKDLYDELLDGDVAAVRNTVSRDASHHRIRMRFLENHDELRAWTTFGVARSTAAALVTFALPGLRLFQAGQESGARERLPVQIGREGPEPGDDDARALYDRLLPALDHPAFHGDDWSPLGFEDAPDASADGLVGSRWSDGSVTWWAIANVATEPRRGRIRGDAAPPVDEAIDVLTDSVYRPLDASADPRTWEMDVPPGGGCLLRFEGA
jgi:hypothetical protein